MGILAELGNLFSEQDGAVGCFLRGKKGNAALLLQAPTLQTLPAGAASGPALPAPGFQPLPKQGQSRGHLPLLAAGRGMLDPQIGQGWVRDRLV